MQANITLEIAQTYGLTLENLSYFARRADDAPNWPGGIASVDLWNDPHKAHLPALEKAGLLETEQEEWNGYRRHPCKPVWVYFTARGKALAAEIGYSIDARA